ncbi:MAG: TetR/AcrR family transcriptional regulator [Candidatus Nanopelagicales bacterium]|jgi:AcrR family transcriptional regulator|nr:TetR/AcrR family transcriptional regulator [Candidatus Nanopelagicales bacterium]
MKSEAVVRPYRMTARADAAERTGERILEAATEIFWERLTPDVSLEEVAARAGVSVRTVIRRFGGKEQLFAAASRWASDRVGSQRDQAVPGDIPGAVVVLLDHYEEYGSRVLGLLAAEATMPSLNVVVVQGRELHWAWCERVFAPQLAGLPASLRRRRLAQYAALCDVYTWKLLRLDADLSRRQTQVALVEMLTSITKES